MQCYRADFHIHSCLSPCADITMTPKQVAKELVEHHIDWAAITDHNSARNLASFEAVFQASGIAFLAGIEIQTIEDIHILGYFPTTDQALKAGFEAEQALPGIQIDPEKNGYQLLVNTDDEFQDMLLKPFGFPTHLTLDQTVDLIRFHNGIAVYAHVDKAMGVITQLGLIPDEPENMPCELYMPSKYKAYASQLSSRSVLSSSDAHNPDSFSEAKMMIRCHTRTFDEFRKALEKEEGREVILCL
ncbi:MAG TPA: PHP domain-containing protein [Thermotogota bacterium]|nr:PHP domain-containing protein [Thermotogota bacterium]